MCGLVGMAGNILMKHDSVFRDLLVFDQVRGFDSSGFVWVPASPSKAPDIEKELDGPTNLWEWGQSSYLTMRGLIDPHKAKGYPKVLLGHNRAATMGKITTENAHPFQYGHIYGAHNGTLHIWNELENSATHDIDSKALIDTIAAKGIDHTWKSFYGAAALTWWDDEESTLNMCRNSERPLYIAENASRDVLFWASEAWMILAATSRSKVELHYEEVDGKQVYARQIPVDTLFSFKVHGTGFEKLEGRKLEKKPRVTIGTSTTSTCSNVTGFPAASTKKKKGKKKVVNSHGWAKNLEKGPKELVGKTAQLSHIADGCPIFRIPLDNGAGYHFMQGVLHLEGELQSKWQGRVGKVFNGKEQTWHFKIQARPRLSDLKMYKYRISTKHLVFSHTTYPKSKVVTLPQFYYPGEGNLTRQEWLDKLSRNGNQGCCLNCDEVIDPVDADKLYWMTTQDNVICPLCQEDPVVKEHLVNHTNYQGV